MMYTDIPPKLLTVMLYRARLARRDLVPGTTEHKGTDVAYLAEHWSGRLFDISLDRQDPAVTQAEMDELRAVMTEVTEHILCNLAERSEEFVLEGLTFDETTEKILTFLAEPE